VQGPRETESGCKFGPLEERGVQRRAPAPAWAGLASRRAEKRWVTPPRSQFERGDIMGPREERKDRFQFERLEERIAPSAALPQPQPPGQFPSGNPPTAPGGSNDPGNSSQ
jgi:hypothetical protein